jgi:hypothetical protein
MSDKITYFIKPEGWHSAAKYCHVSNDLKMVLETYSEEEYDSDGDFEDFVEFEIFDADKNSLGMFTVFKEYAATYTAQKKERKK